MNPARDFHAADAASADRLLQEVCDEFRSSLELAASGAVGRRYAAVPSWYAANRDPGQIPSWSIDGPTARRLLREEGGVT